jgi:hypothetical protein
MFWNKRYLGKKALIQEEPLIQRSGEGLFLMVMARPNTRIYACG